MSEASASGPAPAGDRRPVVVAVDGSASSRAALGWGAHYARLSGLPLVALMAWQLPMEAAWGVAPSLPEDYDPEASALEELRQTVAEVLGDHAGIEVRVEVVCGHPALKLTEVSKSASLVVVGSRGHGAFAGMLLGSVSEFLTTHAHWPVVVMRDHTPAA